MSPGTPERIRTLRRKLYRKVKAEPACRFYPLYDKIHCAEILEHSYALARSNGGAPRWPCRELCSPRSYG